MRSLLHTTLLSNTTKRLSPTPECTAQTKYSLHGDVYSRLHWLGTRNGGVLHTHSRGAARRPKYHNKPPDQQQPQKNAYRRQEPQVLNKERQYWTRRILKLHTLRIRVGHAQAIARRRGLKYDPSPCPGGAS
eukprot:2782731-Rhodomonas_salina.1